MAMIEIHKHGTGWREIFIFCLQCLSDHMFTHTTLVYYKTHEKWNTWTSCWNWLLVCVCVLTHMSTWRNYSSKWELLLAVCQHWFGDWILSQLGKAASPAEERETLCLYFLSIGRACDGLRCLCQLSKQVHLSSFINIVRGMSSPTNNRIDTDKETLNNNAF